MKTIIELTFQMKQLLKLLDISTTTEFERRYQVTDEAVKNLRDDTWQELSRRDLFALFTAAAEAEPSGRFDLLVARPHPLWESFQSDETAIILPAVNNDGAETKECTTVLNVLTSLTGVLRKNAPEATLREPNAALALMKKNNLIAIGPPTSNPRAEVVLCDLLRRPHSVIDPFDGSVANRRRAPFEHKTASRPANSVSVFASAPDDERPYGITLRSRDRDVAVHLPLTDPHGPATKGWDVGVLVARRCPRPGTQSGTFTSMVISGQSWFATQEVAREIATGRLYLGEEAFKDDYVIRYLLCEWERTGTSPHFPYRPSQRVCRWFRFAEVGEVKTHITPRKGSSKQRIVSSAVAGPSE